MTVLQTLERFGHLLRQPERKRLEIADGDPYRTNDAWVFHIFEKTILHLGLRFIRTPPPESWPGLFTGWRSEIARFLLEEYFRYERQGRRQIILEKIFYFGLKQSEYDNNYQEPFSFLLYRLFTKKGLKFRFDNPGQLDPANWYMDTSLHPRAKGQGARNIIPDGMEFFKVIHQDATHLTVDKQLHKPELIIREMDDQFKRQRMKIDLDHGEQIEGGWKYPILEQEPIVDLVNLMDGA